MTTMPATTVMSRMVAGTGGDKSQTIPVATDTARPDEKRGTVPDEKQDTRPDAKQDTRQDDQVVDSIPDAVRREKLRHEREMLAEQQQRLSDELRRLSAQQEKLLEEEMRLSGKDMTLSEQERVLAVQGKLAELNRMQLERKLMTGKKLMDLDQGMSKEERVMMEKKMRDMEANQLAMLQDQKIMAEDMNRKMEAARLAMMQKKLEFIEQDHRKMDANRKMLEENREQLEINRGRMQVEREKRRKEFQETLSPMIEFLSDNKLITDKNDFSFSLDKNGLTINGVKQSDALYQEVREKFLKDRNDKITYSKKNSSESITINRE
jgi:hypothetical protein